MSGGEIVLSAEVWPVYVGFSSGDPGPGPQAVCEPVFSLDYERGQIDWLVEGSEVVGRAVVWVPGGVTFTHMIYLHGPGSLPMMTGQRQLPHPIQLTDKGCIDIYPIRYGDWK